MKRLICIFLCLLTAFLPILSFTGCNSTESISNKEIICTKEYADTPLSLSADTDIYYGRYALSLMSNSTALLHAYDKITAGIENSAAEIIVYNGTNNISTDEIEMVVDAYRRDHAEHFWLGNSYSMTYTEQTVKKITFAYIMSGAALDNAKIQFENAVSSFLSDIDDTMTDYEKELLLHDKLAAKITYVETDNAHNAYGALVEGKAVCEGYAEALQYLLHRVGIQSFIILGTSKNPSSTGDYEGHAWNAVKIGDSFYHVDLTWNDQGEYLFHSYFNQTDSVILNDHEITDTEYLLPVCSSDTANYFKMSGTYLTSYTTNSVATILRNNNYLASVYLPSGVDTFVSWYKSNITSIATKAGIYTAFTYGHIKLGNEVMLILNACSHSSVAPVAATPATCTSGGNIAHYICRACEKLFSDSSATTEITNVYSIKTDPTPHTYTEKLKNTAHIKHQAENCQDYDTYWYDCKDCAANAKDDPVAQDKWYESTDAGEHSWNITEWGYHDENGHAHECGIPGCDAHDEIIPHISSGQATETVAERCTACSYIITPALAHTTHTPNDTWESNSTHHWHECVGCEDKEFNKSEHVYTNDCDKDCNTCGEERQAEHSFSSTLKSDGQKHWKECVCGEKTESVAHTDIDKDKICDECAANIKNETSDSPLDKLIKHIAVGAVIFIAAACVLTVIVCSIIKKLGKKNEND